MRAGDHVLLQRTDAGDADAFAEFFRRHEPAITSFAVRRATDPHEVADIVADTFLVALRRAGDFRADRPTALPWLYGIAGHVLRDRHRRGAAARRLLRRLGATAPAMTADEYAAVDAAIDAQRPGDHVRAALLEIPSAERAVFELVALDGLTPAEAAEALDLTDNAARLRLSRARKRLRGALAALPDDRWEYDHA